MRLFVSLPLPAPARTHLAAALAGLRTTTVEQWHLTLAFVGEWADPAALVPGLRAVAASTPPLTLRVQGGGTLRGVLWAGIAGDVGGVRSLAAGVADACRAAGVELERRPYRPHVTVARRPSDPHRLDGYRGPAWTVTSLTLVRSRLGKRAEHETLERLPFGR